MKCLDEELTISARSPAIQEVELLLHDYKLNLEAHRGVWKTFAQTAIMALTGILASVIIALWQLPSYPHFLGLMPLVISAWSTQIALQAFELMSRDRYLAIVEARIRALMGTILPCWETSFRSIIYRSWRYPVIVLLVALPILLLYGLCAREGLKWISGCLHWDWHIFAVLYVALALLPIGLSWSYYDAITEELKRLQEQLDGANTSDDRLILDADVHTDELRNPILFRRFGPVSEG